MTVTRQRRRTAGSPVIAGLLVLAGVWLFIGAWILGYGINEPVMDAHLNEILVGAGLVIAMLLRLKRPSQGWEWLSDSAAVILGGWLVIAPFALGYGDKGLADEARINDVVTGVVIVVLAATNLLLTVRARRGPTGS